MKKYGLSIYDERFSCQLHPGFNVTVFTLVLRKTVLESLRSRQEILNFDERQLLWKAISF